jgi:hypothetical protein
MSKRIDVMATQEPVSFKAVSLPHFFLKLFDGIGMKQSSAPRMAGFRSPAPLIMQSA